MRLSKFVEQYSAENGYSYREIARRCNLSVQTISNIVNETVVADTKTQAKLAAGLGRPEWKSTVINGIVYIRLPEEEDEEEIPEITMIARAGKRMTPERRQDMLKMLKIAFPDAFKDEK